MTDDISHLIRQAALCAGDVLGNAEEAGFCFKNGDLSECLQRLEWMQENLPSAVRACEKALIEMRKTISEQAAC